MKSKKSMTALLALVILGSAAVGGWYYLDRNGEEATQPAEAVEIVDPQEGTVSVAIDAPALIEPFRRLTVRSSAGGRVTALAEAGEIVKAGEIIAELDPTDLAAQVDRARIDLEEARINRERAQRTLDRARRDLEDTQRLHDAGGVPGEQLENSREAVASAELAMRLAELSVEKAELNLRSARNDLAGATIRAPWDGVILSREVDPGDMVGSNSSLLVVADLERVRVLSEIDEFDVARIRAGLPANVRVEAVAGTGAGPYNSVVELVSPSAQVVSNISVFTVSTVLDNPGIVLRPGMSADLTISIARDEGLVVPARAVTTVRNRSYLDILPREGVESPDGLESAGEEAAEEEYETIRVEIGASDGVHTVVLEGLEPTDRVVIPAAVAGFALPSAPPPSPGGETNSIVPVSVPGTGSSPGGSPSGGSPGSGGGGGGGGR
ncbi:MAG: efflux RND transporter periplasmic adaptor subunit [Spirochaetaceae bacterium]|nr:MAG: efflux RND transporter periplasmic adaptor subunit [Spirochaetaceae bacterium]